MISYLLRRLAQMVPVLFLISLFVFFLVRLVPGSPADALLGFRATPEAIARIEKQFDLDKPIYIQYVSFLRNVAQGDLGESTRRREPVTDILRDRLPKTLFLVGYSMFLAVLISVPLASWAAIRRGPIGAAGLPENPNPGSDATITSKPSPASPPYFSGWASGPTRCMNSKNDPGQPCSSSRGCGRLPDPRSWT